MQRRRFLVGVLGGLMGVLCMGHTPFRQWVVYRKRHLIILTSKTDGAAYELGKRLAAVLAHELPASKARVTRAPYMERIGSLLSTQQLDVALLSGPMAVALRQGQPPFVDYGPLSLRRMVTLGSYVLVCRDDFPDRHAYLVAQALDDHRKELSPPSNTGDHVETIPLHPGALAFINGHPIPKPPDPKP